ncbi:MAG TPA: ATP-binding protein [Thermodesulfobacteriota bacterium]
MTGLPWWRRWRTTLAAAFVLVAVAVAGFQVADVVKAYSQSEARVRTEQVEAAWRLAAAAELLVARHASLAEALAAAVFDAPLSPRARHGLLVRTRAAHPDVAGVAVLDATGRTIDAEPSADIGSDLSGRRPVQALLDGAAIAVGDLIEQPSGQAVVPVMAAVRDLQGALRGAVSIAVPEATFQQELAAHLAGSMGVLLVDRAGKAIVQGGAGLAPDEVRDHGAVPLVSAGLRDRRMHTGEYTSPTDGSARFGTVVPVPGTEWVAVATQSVEAMQAPGRRALVASAVRIGVVLAVSLVLAFLLANRLSRPLAALTVAVERIGDGDLSRRAPVPRRRDELALLAESVNAMAARLERARDESQALNEELAAANEELQANAAQMEDTLAELEAVQEQTIELNTELAGANARLRESEARFRTMADTAPVLVWMAGPDGRRDFFNKPWLEFTGRSLEQETGEGWTEGVHAADLERYLDTYMTAFGARRPFRMDYRLRRHDGEYRWMLDSGVPRFGADGAFVGYVGSSFDITEIKQAEAERSALLERERAARRALERAHRRAAFLVDTTTRLSATLEYETVLATVTRLAVPELADWCLTHVIEPDGSVRCAAVAHADPGAEPLARELLRTEQDLHRSQPVRDVLATGKAAFLPEPPPERAAEVAGDGDPLRLLARLDARALIVVPLIARGRTLGAMTFVASGARRFEASDLAQAEDLARRAALAADNARLYQEAQQAIAEAREAVQAREAFLARASHELRTPLTSALGTIRMLRKSADSIAEPARSLLDVANRNLGAMADLINDLLDVSKLASKQEPLVRSRVELATAVAESLEVVAAQAREKGVALRAAVPGGLALQADPRKLEQVLVNLLANGVKFTPAGGEVWVEARQEDAAYVVIRVCDTGEGIAPTDLEAIFEPFVQAGPREPRRPRGTGLGLTICRQIVMQHGGAIWAESDGPGRGSAFVVRLPAEPEARERAA